MLGKTFSVILILSMLTAIINGNTQRLSFELLEALPEAVTLCLSLLGMMCFWSGIMNVFKCAGLLDKMAGALKKPMNFIYGKNRLSQNDLQNISASFAADFLGLGNAALPFGLAAMRGLNKGNTEEATDTAVMHAVLNTVPIQLIPSTLIAMRSSHNSANPFDVIAGIWLCSAIITVFAVFVCKLFEKLWKKEKHND